MSGMRGRGGGDFAHFLLCLCPKTDTRPFKLNILSYILIRGKGLHI
jgi:hypothetical protein